MFMKQSLSVQSNLDSLPYRGMTWDTIAVYLLLCLSGNTMWSLGNDVKHIYLLAFSLSFIFCWRKGNAQLKHAISYIIFWVLLFCIQAPVCPYFNASSALFYIIKISIAAFVICGVGKMFCETYFRVIYILSIISLVFFTFNCFGIWFTPLVQAFDRNSLFVHTQLMGNHGGLPALRNCGMFWEPGAFQGYIILAFLPYLSKLKEIYKVKRKQVIVMLITLVTTFSTTGFICIFAMYVLYILTNEQLKARHIFSILLVSSIFVYIILGVDAIGTKLGITGVAADSQAGIIGGSRMYHATLYLPKAANYPIFGHGFSNEAMHAVNIKTGSGNGFVALVFYGGLVFTISYFSSIFQAVRNSIGHRTALCYVIMIFLLLQSEGFLGYPLFWGIPLLSESIKYSNLKLLTSAHEKN